jgi:rhodanese-related sulfurtransferase
MNTFTQLFVIAGISAAAAGGTWLVKKPSEKVALSCDASQISDEEICLADVPDTALWIDARSREEWNKNGLKGSILWNMDPSEDANLFEADAAAAILNADFVVVYCGSKACGTSKEIAKRIRLLNLGPKVKSLYGGWEAIKDSSAVLQNR